MITYPLIFYAISSATLRHMVQNRSVITGQLSLNNPCLRRYLPFDYFRRKKKNFLLISFHFSPLLFYTEEKKTRLVESSDIDIINPSSAVNRATPVFLQAVFFTSGLARYVNQTEGYKINKSSFMRAGLSADNVLGREYLQNFTFALEVSLLGHIFIFGTISQPRT